MLGFINYMHCKYKNIFVRYEKVNFVKVFHVNFMIMLKAVTLQIFLIMCALFGASKLNQWH